MNNLHRELAPISDKAWAQIEEEALRTIKRHLAARRVVDVPDPKGLELAAVGTGHLHQIPPPGDGIQAALRDAKAIVEQARKLPTHDLNQVRRRIVANFSVNLMAQRTVELFRRLQYR